MAAIDYPFDLRTLIVGRQKTQFAKIAESQPLSGPAYQELRSTDAPVVYEGVFRFGTKNEALLFRAWVEVNGIDKGTPFNFKIKHEGAGDSEATETQEVVAFPNGGSDLLSNAVNGLQLFEYPVLLRCRKETTGLEDYYDLIQEGGLYLLQGRGILDVALNKLAPEYP